MPSKPTYGACNIVIKNSACCIINDWLCVPVHVSHFLPFCSQGTSLLGQCLLRSPWFSSYVNFGVAECAVPNQLISGYFQACSSEKANQLCRKLGTVLLCNHCFFAWNFVNTDSTWGKFRKTGLFISSPSVGDRVKSVIFSAAKCDSGNSSQSF